MMSLDTLSIAEVVGGVHKGDAVAISNVSTDTRQLNKGDLFVALSGERFDANDFIDQAVDAGAAAIMTTNKDDVSVPSIHVADTWQALVDLAKHVRHISNIPVIGITGSNGKTSVKEMLSSILRQSHAVLATQGNLNNHIGVPLTLLCLDSTHQIAVVEMGASQAGDIQLLCEIAKPNVTILNNVGAAHLEGFGSLAGVASAKGEIVTGLSEDGVAVLNIEEPWFDQWKTSAGQRKIVSFGWSDQADCWAEPDSVKTDLVNGAFSTAFTLHLHDKTTDIQLNLVGRHNVMNALAAISAADSLNVGLRDIKAGLLALKEVPGRMQVVSGLNGSLLINDCYNANPKSFAAALDSVQHLNADLWVVLGDFAELGEQSEKLHKDVGSTLSEMAIAGFLAVGQQMKSAIQRFNEVTQQPVRAQHFESKERLVTSLKTKLKKGDVVLVKGSRSQGLEVVIEGLRAEEVTACC